MSAMTLYGGTDVSHCTKWDLWRRKITAPSAEHTTMILKYSEVRIPRTVWIGKGLGSTYTKRATSDQTCCWFWDVVKM
jgi:hypothetical protein